MSKLLDTPTGRLGNGRFAPGNTGGPGNPNARQTAQIRQALFKALTEEKMAVIVDALIDKATEGNMQAIKMVLHYTIGKPGAAAAIPWDFMDTPSPNGDNGQRSVGIPEPSPNGHNGHPMPEPDASAPLANGENGAIRPVEAPKAPIANGANGQDSPPAANSASALTPKLSRRAQRKLREAVKRAGLRLGGR